MFQYLIKQYWRGWYWLSQNPVISRDFILNLRKARYFALMAMLLIGGTFGITLQWASEINTGLPIGRRLFFAFLTSELLVLVFVLPGLMANSIITERDRNILPMLLTTPLGPVRILFGKTVSSAGVVVLLLVSTFPLIAICMSRGGVAPWELIGGCFLIVYAGWAIASFALYHALQSVNTIRAVLATQFSLVICYVILVPTGSLIAAFISNIIGAIYIGFVPGMNTGIRANLQMIPWVLALGLNILFWVGIPVYMFLASLKQLNDIDPRVREQGEMNQGVEFQFGQRAVEKQTRSFWEDGLNKNPFYVREQIGMRAGISPYSVPAWYLIIVTGHFFMWFAVFTGASPLGIISLLIIAPVIPAYSAGLIAGEREQQTWDLLRTTCMQPGQMLYGKMIFALRQSFLRGVGLYMLPVGIGTGLHVFIKSARNEEFFVLNYFVELALLFTHLGFITMLCLFLSTFYENIYTVYSWCYSLIAVYLFGPLFLMLMRGENSGNMDILLALSPVAISGDLVVNGQMTPETFFFQIIFYCVASVLLYWLTCQQIKKEA